MKKIILLGTVMFSGLIWAQPVLTGGNVTSRKLGVERRLTPSGQDTLKITDTTLGPGDSHMERETVYCAFTETPIATASAPKALIPAQAPSWKDVKWSEYTPYTDRHFYTDEKFSLAPVEFKVSAIEKTSDQVRHTCEKPRYNCPGDDPDCDQDACDLDGPDERSLRSEIYLSVPGTNDSLVLYCEQYTLNLSKPGLTEDDLKAGVQRRQWNLKF